MNRLALLLAMNDDFAKAYRNGEKWAQDRVLAVAALDHPTRNFPERDEIQDGKKRNWCGSCPFKAGCMACDLPYDPVMKGMIGTITPYRVDCKSCGFEYGRTESTTPEEAEAKAQWGHRLHASKCSAKLIVTEVPDV